jgi:flavin reductase (DIM6/NTAB) family NADH-FMN oxidoreductase RutF
MADKIQMTYTDHFDRVMKVMTGNGLLLATWKDEGKTANAMTIGWGLIGSVWSRPIFQVAVRPSRYTFELLEKQRNFTVNVLPHALDDALTICGTKSGRDRNKLAECGLSAQAGETTGGPVIRESVIHYECRIIHANDFRPEAMIPDVREGAYPSGDYHRVYWGQIIDCRVDPEGIKSL